MIEITKSLLEYIIFMFELIGIGAIMSHLIYMFKFEKGVCE